MVQKKIIKTIFLKEMKEVWRDKKTLFWIILSPMFLYPFIMLIVGQFMGMQKEKIDKAIIPVYISNNLNQSLIADSLRLKKQFNVQLTNHTVSDSLKLDRGIFICAEGSYDSIINNNNSLLLKIFYNGTNDFSTIAKEKTGKIIKYINQSVLNDRLKKINADSSFINPINVQYTNTSSNERSFSNMLGKFLPGIILLFIFLGAAYIAMDITAGEKERKTLQSLYAAPVKSYEIVIGKFLPVYVVSLSSAIANLLGLLVALFWQMQLVKNGAEANISIDLSFATWIWIFILLMMVAGFISSISMAIMALAKTYKEASSYVTPLMMLLVVPLILYSLPAMEINSATALIPVLNVVLAISELFKGITDNFNLIVVAGSSLCYTIFGLYLAKRIFSNEYLLTGERMTLKTLLQGNKENKSKYFGASNSLLFYAVLFLMYIYVAVPMQTKLNLLVGLPLSFFTVLGLLSFLVIKIFRLPLKDSLQLNKPGSSGIFATLLVTIGATCLMIVLATYIVNPDYAAKFAEQLKPLFTTHFIYGLLLTAALPAVFEEVVFRGILIHGLRKEMSKWNVILITSLAFALLHLSLERLIPTFLLGIILGFIAWHGRSLYLCMLFHFVYNSIHYLLARYEFLMQYFVNNNPVLLLLGFILLFIGIILLLRIDKKTKINHVICANKTI